MGFKKNYYSILAMMLCGALSAQHVEDRYHLLNDAEARDIFSRLNTKQDDLQKQTESSATRVKAFFASSSVGSLFCSDRNKQKAAMFNILAPVLKEYWPQKKSLTAGMSVGDFKKEVNQAIAEYNSRAQAFERGSRSTQASSIQLVTEDFCKCVGMDTRDLSNGISQKDIDLATSRSNFSPCVARALRKALVFEYLRDEKIAAALSSK